MGWLRILYHGGMSREWYNEASGFVLINDEDNQQVLYKGALVEYRGKQSGVPWCDAHPLLWHRLRQIERDRDTIPTEEPA
jgi:hypothetical protein